jgi:hypothetical protein
LSPKPFVLKSNDRKRLRRSLNNEDWGQLFFST